MKLFNLLLVFFVLVGCASTDGKKPDQSVVVTGERVDREALKGKKLTPIEPEEGESQFSALFRLSGLPQYSPTTKCKDALEDLKFKRIEILSVERHRIIAQAPNLNIKQYYEFPKSRCN